MNPILKWAGGKRKLVPRLIEEMPATIGRYIEPCLGGGALFFALEPRYAILGDLNEKLIATYTTIRDNPVDVAKVLGILADGYDPGNKEYYYGVRRAFNSNHLFTPLAFAAQFLFLNRTCFNGLFRTNRKGDFNVPMGRYKRPSFPTGDDLIRAARVLEHSSLRAAHFVSVLDLAQEGDFVYCDPPYDGTYSGYNGDGFSEPDQITLASMLSYKGKRGVKWMASNADTPLIRDLYAGHNIIEIQAGRSINSDVNGRGKITELLIKNY